MDSPIDINAWKTWTPAAQQKALELLQRHRNDTWRPFYCTREACDGLPHDDWEWNHARVDQHPPRDMEWLVWLMKSGRGGGKTRAGSEYSHRMTEVTGRIAIVGATGPDARDTMLEGEAGILTIAPPGKRPHYEPSKRRLTWPNGCVATVFSAEEPDRLRGPEHGYAWVDEAAHFALIQEVWDNLMFGLRIGKRPRVCVTTTPRPRPWLRELLADPTTRVTTTSTYANLGNLAPTFADRIIKRYEGTRLGRQELLGEMLEDVEGSLWAWELIEPHRTGRPAEFDRVVVAVDPAGTANRHSDETGIIVVGRIATDIYVLADRSGRMSPNGWARAVDAAVDEFSADAVVAETNYGGDMVTNNLRASGFLRRVIKVNSRRGKALRAEPVVGLYEQGYVHHCGVFTDLEEQQTTWRPYEDRDSPDRVDALVHGITALAGKSRTADVAGPDAARAAAERFSRQRRHLGPVRR